MTSAASQVVIVGGGQAGSCAAFAMRRAGFGGRLVLLAEEAVAPYERPPLSKGTLSEAQPRLPAMFAPERYASHDMELRLSTPAEGLDLAQQRVRLADGSRIAFDALLLATGGRARRLAVPGGEHIHYLRSFDDALALRPMLKTGTRVLCIGAGVIGLELASTARAAGCEVVVAEAAGHIMGRCLASAEAQWLEALHRASGVQLRLHSGVTDIVASNGAKMARFADGSAVTVDLVIAGVGMTRETKVALEAGLAVDNGILVDEFGRTSSPGVFAAGDVAAFWHPTFARHLRLESWHHAQDHGTAVGKAMAGQPEPYAPTPRFWTDQHGINLQVAGAPPSGVQTVVRGSRSDASFTALHLDGEHRLVGVTAADRARDMRPAIELIRAGARLDAAALAREEVPLSALAGEATRASTPRLQA